MKITDMHVNTINPDILDVLRKRVTKGRNVLVKKFGKDYVKKINPDRLYMNDFQGCILGQTFGEYSKGVARLAHKSSDSLEGRKWGINHGFLLELPAYGDPIDGIDPDFSNDLLNNNCSQLYSILGELWREQMIKDSKP